MTIDGAMEAKILRLRLNEHWPVGSIATQLKIHRSVVDRVLNEQQRGGPMERKKRVHLADGFEDFLKEMLEKYPNIHGSRLFVMAQERGYKGTSQGHFRRVVRSLRPRKPQEAFWRNKTLPGEQAQADWADFGEHPVSGGSRRLSAFVLALSHSRVLFCQFFWSTTSREFFEGFATGFAYFGGVPRKVLIDNLKSGVQERVGSNIQFNPGFLEFSKHYRFEPCAANIRRGNEKGRVERGIRYIRENFFPGRVWQSLEDLNAQVLHWCNHIAQQRQWQRCAGPKTVEQAWHEEKAFLLPLPEAPYVSSWRELVRVGKTPYGRFDTNDYSVPAVYVGQTLEVYATPTTVTFFQGPQQVAQHLRTYGKHQTVEDPAHLAEVLKQKPGAKEHSGLARLTAACPLAEAFVQQVAQRGDNLGGAISSLLRLLDIHGAPRLTQALEEVLAKQTPHLRSVGFVLSRLEEAAHSPARLSTPLPASPWQHHHVAQHNPAVYDALIKEGD